MEIERMNLANKKQGSDSHDNIVQLVQVGVASKGFFAGLRS